MSKSYIYGAGGHGKVVLDAMRSINKHCDGFIDDRPVMKYAELSVSNIKDIKNEDCIHIAIGNSAIREKISTQCEHKQFISIFHQRSAIAETSSVSNIGTFVAAYAVIGPDATVGNHSIVNHGAVVDHDCNVGNFCHIAPNAVLGGEASIGNHVLIGAGAVILPGVTISDHVLIGAGAVVTKDIATSGTFIGTPATLLKK